VGFIQKIQNSLLFICYYCIKHHSVPQFGAFERTLNNFIFKINHTKKSPLWAFFLEGSSAICSVENF
jgi:hypothetical protein